MIRRASYWDKEKTQLQDEYYVDAQGLRQGERKWFHKNGALQMHTFYVDDKLNGGLNWFYENGELESHSFSRDDKREGEAKSYYRGGGLEVHAFYENGKLHGEYKSYRKTGEIRKQTFFGNGKEITKKEYEELQMKLSLQRLLELGVTYDNIAKVWVDNNGVCYNLENKDELNQVECEITPGCIGEYLAAKQGMDD